MQQTTRRHAWVGPEYGISVTIDSSHRRAEGEEPGPVSSKAEPLSQGAVDTRFLQLSRKAHSLVWLAGKVKIVFLHF